jgi:hypothetical protein
MDIARLQEKLGNIPDPQRPWGNLRHKLEDIPVIALAALLCSGEDFEDMEAFGLERTALNPGMKGEKQTSGPKKRFAAAMNPDYRGCCKTKRVL